MAAGLNRCGFSSKPSFVNGLLHLGGQAEFGKKVFGVM